MVFPDTPLPIKVEISPAGSWVNITEYVYVDDILITRGSADESAISQPTTATFRLNNIDGRFSPRNPNGPYYGQLGRNTPILISVETGDRYLDLPGLGYAETADSAQISITGDIDIRLDATMKNWAAEGSSQGEMELIGKYLTTGNQRSWLVSVNDNGYPFYRWSVDGTATTGTGTSTSPISPDPGGRLAIRVTHDVNDGAGGNVITFYTAPTIDGPWEQLGDPVTNSGTTSIFDSTTSLKVGDASNFAVGVPYGKIWAAKVFNGINGTVAADIDFRIQDDGDTSFTGADGLTWTTQGGASINNQYNRFRGEVVAWPARWVTGGFDAWIPMEAQSIRRRLGQGQKALQSTLRRRIPTDPDVVAYWPLEEGEDATRFGSGLSGGAPMTFTGDVDPAAHVGPHGSDNLPSFNENCSWFAPVPAAASVDSGWQVEWIFNIQQVTGTLRTIMQVQGSGTVKLWKFQVDNTGASIKGFNAAGTAVVDQDVALDINNDFLNKWARWQFRVVDDGANVDWTSTWIPIGGAGGTFSGTYAGTEGRVTAISGVDNLSADIAGLSWGHIAVFNTATGSSIFNSADHGFTGESAWDRFVRLAEEEGVAIDPLGNPDETFDMGAQRPDKLLDLLDECAEAEQGIMGDTRDWADSSAFKFITRAALYNQVPRLTLGYRDDGEVHAPLDPTDDDQYTRNVVTAERERGSTSTVEVTDGPLGTAEIGTYDTQVTLNVESDDQLIHHAGWQAHLGTHDEERYPTVLVKVHAATGLLNEVLEVDQGSRIRIKDARGDNSETQDRKKRTWIPPGDIDLQVRGYTERLSQFEWEVEYQCIPARPYDVNKADHLDQQTNRIDTDGTDLSEALDTTETEVEVFTSETNPRTGDYITWTDRVSDMPFDWLIGGEALTVIAPGALANTNPLFDSDITGWTVSGATGVHSTAVLHPDPMAIGSAKITPDGVTASGGLTLTTRTAVGSITPAGQYKASCWVYAVEAHTDVRTAIDFYDSSNVLISSEIGSATSVAAGVWTFLEQTLTAPANASRAATRFRFGGTPASTKIFYVWDLTISRILASAVYDRFGRTATDTWTTADSSQTWTNSGGAASEYDVLSGYGRHTLTSVSVSRRSGATSPYADVDLYCDVTTSATATGGSIFGGTMARYADVDNMYMARLEFTTANTIILTVRERVAGVETQLGSSFTHWKTHVAGTSMRLRFQVVGSALKAKAWLATDPEPDVWQVETTDSSLTSAASVGCRSILAAGNTNVNPEVRFDNFELANPQVYSVLRSRNGIVKSHSSGADVVLRYPMILAL